MLLKKSAFVVSALLLALLLFGQSSSFGQSDPPLQFTVYGDVPIIARGAEDTWDSGSIYGTQV